MPTLLFINALENEDKITTLIDAIERLAILQQTQGSEWSVNGAAFIVIAIIAFLALGSVFGYLIKSIINQQKHFTEKFLNDNDIASSFADALNKNTIVIDKVSNYLSNVEKLSEEEAKKEINNDQFYVLLKWSLENAKRKIVLDTYSIIDGNNLDKIGSIENKIDELVRNTHASLVSGLNKFQIKGNKLGDMSISDNYISRKKEIIYSHIYSDNRDRAKFNKDLDNLFETFSNQIRNKIVF